MNRSAICAVAFDAVGTLIHPDPTPAAVYAAVGRRFGSRLHIKEIRSRFTAAFAAQEQLDAQNDLATSEEREQRRWQEIVAHVLNDVADHEGCFAELYAHFGRPSAWRVDGEAGELLARLKRADYPIALASNYDRRLRGVVAGLEALEPIHCLIISSEVGWRKPAREFFGHLTSTLALQARDVLYIGDDPVNDFEGARNARLPALLFDPRGRHSALKQNRLGNLGDLRLPRLT
jgi:putative hydrolase of the HAD superfamily